MAARYCCLAAMPPGSESNQESQPMKAVQPSIVQMSDILDRPRTSMLVTDSDKGCD